LLLVNARRLSLSFVDQCYGDGMALTQKIDMEADTISQEARERINSARIRDISFLVKQRIGSGFSAEDVEMLVDAIQQALGNGDVPTKSYVLTYLRSRGRSPDRSEQLASALLK
jgi:hypothetical protein